MTKEELNNTKIWFGYDAELRDKIFAKIKSFGIGDNWKNSSDAPGDIGAYYIYGSCLQKSDQDKGYFNRHQNKEILPPQLLGEDKWIPKVGDWVILVKNEKVKNEALNYSSHLITNIPYQVIFSNKGRVGGEEIDLIKLKQCPHNYGIPLEKFRPCNPDEIPQTEVEYVEAFGHYTLTNGKIYPVIRTNKKWHRIINDKGFEDGYNLNHVKPSTRQAYEAQQKKQYKEIPIKVTIEWNDEEVNKCSTINQKQNEYKNQTIEVCGPDFTIGRSDQIRGKGFDYPESEITVGSGYLPNKARSIEC